MGMKFRNILLLIVTFLSCWGSRAKADEFVLQYPDISSGSTPFVEFRARAAHVDRNADLSAGHAFIVLGRKFGTGKEIYFGAAGFYPSDASGKLTELKNLMLSSGQIKYGISDLHNDSVYRTAITPEQERQIKFMIQNWNDKQYAVLAQNCVSFERAVARYLGLNVPEFNPASIDDEFPNKFVQHLSADNVPDAAMLHAQTEDQRVNERKQQSVSEQNAVKIDVKHRVENSEKRLGDAAKADAARRSLPQLRPSTPSEQPNNPEMSIQPLPSGPR
jgi:hypothetical protein